MRVNVDDALRYAGVRVPSGMDRAAMESRAERVLSLSPPRFLYRVFALEAGENGMLLTEAGLSLPGALARKMLSGCRKAALMVCTLGAGFDAMLRAAQARDMAEAVLLDACGSAAVEAGCDAAEKEIAARFPRMYRTDRFSPGYGDLPLESQKEILRLLDAEKRLGVHAAPSCLMLPMKTVTAAVGLADAPQPARIRGCAICALRERCALRQGGTSCGLEE